jgi:hypothetical protein
MNNPIKCFVTIDVEPDNVWNNPSSKSLENIKELEKFNDLCREFEIKINYFLTYSVVNDKKSIKIIEKILKSGNSEIGIHTHLWEIPPFVDADKKNIATTARFYSNEILDAKFFNITNQIKKVFYQPVSHRAGRFGFTNSQISILKKNKIRIDSSVLPGIDWSDTGIENYQLAPNKIYEMSEFNFLKSGNSRIIQVPCTIKQRKFTYNLLNLNFFNKVINKLGYGPQWLRVLPDKKIKDLINITKWSVDKNLDFLNLMSHSSEFMAQGSPYWKTKNEIDYQFLLYKNLFTYWREMNFEPMLLSSLDNKRL